MNFEIGGIPLLALVPGIVEASKTFGLKGPACQALSITLGTVFIGLGQAIELSLIPIAWLPWITVLVVGLGGGLAVSGYYTLVKRTGVFKA
jgi:hypothetical protein